MGTSVIETNRPTAAASTPSVWVKIGAKGWGTYITENTSTVIMSNKLAGLDIKIGFKRQSASVR